MHYLVGNLVSPLLNGLSEVLDDGSLGNLSDGGKGIGTSLRETKTGGGDGSSLSGDGVGNVGRASGVISGDGDSRLGKGNLGRGGERGSIFSRDGGSSRGSGGIGNRGNWGSGSYGSSSITSIASSEVGVGSAIGKTSSIDLDRVSHSRHGSHTGSENGTA